MRVCRVTLFIAAAVFCSGFFSIAFAVAPVESRETSNADIVWNGPSQNPATTQQYVAATPSTPTPVTHSENQAGNATNYSRLSQLETEVRELRGELEQQAHKMQQMISLQTKLFQDMDHRLNGLGATSAKTQVTQANQGSQQTTKSPESESEQRAYETAYGLLKSKQYVQAKYAIQTFLKNYPEGEYAPNAHYWLGELSLLTGDSQLASKEFETLIKNYPASPKISDAMLKIGILYLEKNDKKMAKQQFESVITKFPNSPSASIAKKRLQML